jgi:hypothetical protein
MFHHRNVGAALAIGLLAILFIAGEAPAQSTTGSIIGTVRDSTGGALPGVTVTAVNQANGATRETITDELGA